MLESALTVMTVTEPEHKHTFNHRMSIFLVAAA